jgi:NDP-sugar pyrophosphorylase family protein
VHGRPFLHWQLDRLEQAGFRRVMLLTGHLAPEVMRAAHSWRGDLAIVEARDPDTLPEGMSWGTGHAVRFVSKELHEPTLLLYGDVYPRGDISAPLRLARGGRMVMSVSRAGRGNCTVRDGRVVDYGMASQWLDAGCMAIHGKHFQRLTPMHRRRLEDWLVTFAQAGIVDALEVPASLDVGTPDALVHARAELEPVRGKDGG